jgi:hypothetical protein
MSNPIVVSVVAGGLAILIIACSSTPAAVSTIDPDKAVLSGTDDGEAGAVTDSGIASSDAGSEGGPFCSTPLLADAGPATLDEVPVAAWCAATPGGIKEWTASCGGFLAVSVQVGVDCDRQYVFDATSRRLVAVVAGCNGDEHCTDGDPTFEPPVDPDADFYDIHCLYARVMFDLCADGAATIDP